jgi:hypothetical protein
MSSLGHDVDSSSTHLQHQLKLNMSNASGPLLALESIGKSVVRRRLFLDRPLF